MEASITTINSNKEYYAGMYDDQTKGTNMKPTDYYRNQLDKHIVKLKQAQKDNNIVMAEHYTSECKHYQTMCDNQEKEST